MDMAFSAARTFLAVAVVAKPFTDERRRRDSHVYIFTVWIGAISSREISARRSSLWGQFMREITRISTWTFSRLNKLLTYRHLGRVVGEQTVGASWA